MGPAAPGKDLQGAAPRDADYEQAVYDRLFGRPLRSINVPTTAASRLLLGEQCILVGYSLRETTGLAGAEIEFINGGDAGGEPVAELNILAPPLTIVGQTDTDIDASAAVAAAANTATLPGVAGQTTFISGFEITGLGATAAATVTVTVTGVLGGTKTYQIAIPAGVTLGITPLVVEFARPIPANAANVAIAVVATSPGAGNTAFAVTAHGFQRLALPAGANVGQEGTRTMPGGGLLLRSGLFLRVLSGSVTGAVWVRV